jgi:hypothetical protein
MTQTDKERYEGIERYIRQLDTNGQKVAVITAITELIYALDAAIVRANDAAEREGRIEQDCGWLPVTNDRPPLYVPVEILCTDGVRLDDGFVLPGDDGEPVGVRSVIKWRPGKS